jgi:phosphoribosylanthranilate isomerase
VVDVKVCGITSAEDARLAVELGARMLGFNFYPRSPRYLSPAAAGPLVAALPPEVVAVGVFVNASVEEIAGAVRASGIGAAQLHGEESEEFSRELRRRVPGVRIIKAVATGTEFAAERAVRFPADALLIDAACDGFGGSGLRADWKLARRTAELLRGAAEQATALILAGGLNAENVAEAIAAVEPAAVDVCSGVEAAKGRKDQQKLRDFFDAVRSCHGKCSGHHERSEGSPGGWPQREA